MNLPPNIKAALESIQGSTIVAVEESPSTTSLILKIDFAITKHWNTLVQIDPMIGLYQTGPVFRLGVLMRSGLSGRPLIAGDTFLNPAAVDDMRLITHLASQDKLNMHIFNMKLRYLVTKQIRWSPQTAKSILDLIPHAINHIASIDPAVLNFSAARDAMIADIDK